MAHEQDGVGDSQHNSSAEQDFWATFPAQNAADTDMRFDCAEQALLEQSLRLVQLLQDGGTENRTYREMASTVDTSSQAVDFWQSGDLEPVAVKREGQNDETCSEVPRDSNDYGQMPPSNRSSPTSSLRSRPHAAVEKRYRRTVNTKLQQLHSSIPASGSFSLDPTERFRSSTDGSEPEQAAKPVVLDKAIQYTTHLIETYQKYDNEIESLRRQVREWLGEDGPSPSPANTTRSAG
ncbi:Putative myc-type, basic helix-loop-helix (bHLH) domain-containing protein [Septoria linicola]|uniref:Myc-type, basic helix-loop-helix (BHLH) domain-containing protein n=1 Tax=Septoria linicola TaxID=215465 RepID=A0A9Q9AUG6_9PEZI|nr:putative myc-type, basic helix-loop-helix (bHLH) domain-containing protein [Septoria linicola]USW55355.1 Putative myc-type, basic helix-loop-helix (bHLH) domain-containing protein [Septoria linicola]